MCKPTYEELEILLKAKDRKIASLQSRMMREVTKAYKNGERDTERKYAEISNHAVEIALCLGMYAPEEW